MKKLLTKFFAILLSILCVIGMGTPVSAAGQDTYFSFKENDIKMHIGESYQIQYQISSNYVITSTMNIPEWRSQAFRPTEPH